MNQKKAYKPDKPGPEYLHEVKVNGRRLAKGMEATLASLRLGGNNRRYEFCYGEIVTGRSMRVTNEGIVPSGPIEEVLFLTFYGPVRSSKQRYRQVRAGDVVRVHSKTEAR